MITLFVTVTVVSILGIRGQHSIKPPLMVFPDMDEQPKYKAQSGAGFENWADGRVARPVPAGALGRAVDSVQAFDPAYQQQEAHVTTGKNPDGTWVARIPIPVTHALMALGQEKYTINCKVCHDAVGSGNGITGKFGMVGMANYHSDRLRLMADGEIYNTIVHGKGQMLAYGDKLSVEERWAVVLYLRALQKARMGTLEEVPQQERSQLQG